MEKTFTITCPVQNETCTMSISYSDASDMEEPIYVKQHYTCQYRESTNKCNVDHCPVYASAPENL